MERNLLRCGKSYCIHHGEVDVLIEPDGTMVHYEQGMPEDSCYGMFVETPPPPHLTEEEWESLIIEVENFMTEEQLWLY